MLRPHVHERMQRLTFQTKASWLAWDFLVRAVTAFALAGGGRYCVMGCSKRGLEPLVCLLTFGGWLRLRVTVHWTHLE